MDNKTLFIRTNKGEDEVHSRTMHLPGDIKRALLMVDGTATYGEISKRAAPSLRSGLDAMLQELEKDGYIVDKAKASNIPKMSVPHKMSVPPKMSAPLIKMAKPHQSPPVDENAGDLDFMSGFSATASKTPESEPDETVAIAEKLKAEALAAQEIEAAKFKAQQEAEAILHKAEQEAARIRAEAEREKQRAAAEIHAREKAAQLVNDEMKASQLRDEQVIKARLEAEAKVRIETENRVRQDAKAKAKAKAKEVPPTAKPDTFAFDEFNVDEPHHSANQYKVNQPVQKASSSGAASAGKPDTFAFGAFNVDEPQSLVKPHKVDQPAQKSTPNETAHAGKPGDFSFDSFKIDIPEPAVESPRNEKDSTELQPDNTRRTNQSEETRQPVQQESPDSVASKPADGTPSKEEIQRATQERKAVEKRIEEEELAAKKQAEAQVKAHAEAEKRAAEAARAELEKAASQVKYSVDAAPPSAKPASIARVKRKPFSWGKLAGIFIALCVFLLVLLVGALFAVPYVMPMHDYKSKVEKFLSNKLHQPVHVGHLSGRILPTPRLELGGIYIGEVKQLQAEQVLVNFAITGLLVEEKPIDSIELQGVKVSGAGLLSVSSWMQQLAVDNQYPVSSIAISQGMLDADAVQFADVEGTLDFNKAGEFTKASLSSNTGKYMLEINTALSNKLQVVIKVRGSALPLLPDWSFDELVAKGELNNNNLSISEFEGKILGGVLQGKASLGWQSGWYAQGTMVAKSITMQSLNDLLEGNVDGSANFKMSAVNLAGLAGSAELDGRFMAKNGVISGVDIIETARTRSREHLPGGRSRFEEFSGSFAYANNALHFKHIKVTTSVLNADAKLDIDKQQLSGSITAKLSLQGVMKPIDLQINGMTDRPTLRFAP